MRHELRRIVRGGCGWRSRFDRNGDWRGAVIDIADEAKPALVECANEALVVAAVAERAPRGADEGAQRRLRDDAALPHRIDQLVLADDAIAVANQVNQEIEHLRLDVNDRARVSQLMACNINLEIRETEDQATPPGWEGVSSPFGGDLSNRGALSPRSHFTDLQKI